MTAGRWAGDGECFKDQAGLLTSKVPLEELPQTFISTNHDYHIILWQDLWMEPIRCAFKVEKRCRWEETKDIPGQVPRFAQSLLLTAFLSALFRILMKCFIHIMKNTSHIFTL